jgi:hypothetical protein
MIGDVVSACDVCISFAQMEATNEAIITNMQWIAVGCFIAGFALSDFLTWVAYRYGGPIE